MRDRREATVPNLDVDAIVRVLDEAPVTLAVLYGSYARGDTTARSDIDLAVEFKGTLPSVDQTRARLGLIERLTTELETDEIDAVPLSRVPTELLEDGILIRGSMADLERYIEHVGETTSHRDRLTEFDDLLTELERVV